MTLANDVDQYGKTGAYLQWQRTARRCAGFGSNQVQQIVVINPEWTPESLVVSLRLAKAKSQRLGFTWWRMTGNMQLPGSHTQVRNMPMPHHIRVRRGKRDVDKTMRQISQLDGVSKISFICCPSSIPTKNFFKTKYYPPAVFRIKQHLHTEAEEVCRLTGKGVTGVYGDIDVSRRGAQYCNIVIRSADGSRRVLRDVDFAEEERRRFPCKSIAAGPSCTMY
ncbi:hypothetical protein EDB80DRAFT_675963 [Ilyonectria destructans]|nr:hypothetical protein EDB80DRAFT_675963 [Ilyonectria destructans]